MANLKVVSWNVNSVNARLDRLIAFLKERSPDVVCLQELKCEDPKFPSEVIERLGYYCTAYGQKTYNGVAVLSKEPPLSVVKSFHDADEDPSARFLSVQLPKLTVLCAYIPNGQEVGSEPYFYKLKWLGRLRAYLDSHHQPQQSLLLSGDFNVAPEDRDVHDPALWQGKLLCSDPERKALRQVVSFGLQDTLRLHHPEAGLYSWWDYRQLSFPRNQGLRIDFVFCTEPLAKSCVNAYIDRDYRKGEKPSDHAPVVAEFTI